MKGIGIDLRHGKALLKGRLPGQLVIQYSNRCNADCPQCGMRRSNEIPRHTLTKDRVKKLIDDAAEAGIRSLSFTGGEPLLFLDDIVELIGHAQRAGIPYIRTGTNGFFLRDGKSAGFTDQVLRIAEKLAATSLYTFWISLDSAVAEDHEALRGLPGVVKGIEKALPIFHRYGIYPSVNLGINRATGGKTCQPFLQDMGEEAFFMAFCKAFSRFYHLAEDLGFTIVNACYPMSDAGEDPAVSSKELDTRLYGAASKDSMIVFTKEEKRLLFKALYETIPQFRDRLRIFSPRCSLYLLQHKFSGGDGQPLFSCRGGSDFFFVECDKGRIYPCGYLDKPLERFPDRFAKNAAIEQCDRCEWECFRDPSDLMGPFAEFFTKPFGLAKKIVADPKFFWILQKDLRYYRACGYFNGRQAPNFARMAGFAEKNNPA